MPTLIQFRSGDRIINTYDASGQKLRVDYYTIIHELATPLTAGDVYNQPYNPAVMNYEGTCFAGNKEYGIYKTPVTVNGITTYQDVFTWKRIHTQEGYVDYYSTPMVNRYNYYRKDHLGSNREVWRGEYKNYHGTEVGSRIVQRMQYYPSGLPWAESVSPENNNRKYNGKEWIEMHGYDTYDYGARNMFPAVGGRFMTVDPLAEEYYSISLYAYCAGNPVNAIDPDGKDYWTTNDPELIRAFFNSIGSGKDTHDLSQWNHVENSKFINDFKATFDDETGKFLTSYGIVENGIFTLIGVTINTSIRPGLTSYGWPYKGLQVYSPIGNDFWSKTAFYVFGQNSTYNVGRLSWNVNASGRITGIQPLTGTPDLIDGRTNGKIFIKGFNFIDKIKFHRILKPKILKEIGKSIDISKIVGNNPDIIVEKGKIILQGTGGGFKGKIYNTGLSATDFLK